MSVLSYTKKPLFNASGHAHIAPNDIAATYQGWMAQMAGVAPFQISSVSWSGGVVTVNTIGNHPFVTGGQYVLITGLTPSGYNGLFPPTYISATSFSYPLASNPGSITTIATTGLVWSARGDGVNGFITVTTASAHGYVNGQKITIAGITPTTYNGTFEVIVTGTTTFTYNLPGASTTPGTVTIQGTTTTAGYSGIRGECLAPIGGLDVVYADLIVTPTISSVTSTPTGTATINTGSTITLTVNWSEIVQVVGQPYINITIGGNVRQALYATGSGTAVWTFVYQVVAGDTGTGGTVATAISLAGNEALLDISPPSGNELGNHSQSFTPPTFSAPSLAGITWN